MLTLLFIALIVMGLVGLLAGFGGYWFVGLLTLAGRDEETEGEMGNLASWGWLGLLAIIGGVVGLAIT